ncbi:MAG: prolyl oligopeptidase family serine peptidase [Opitutales bacterium]
MNHARACFGLLCLLPAYLLATPQESLDLVFATQRYQNVALATDGRHLAWVEARPNADRTPSTRAALMVVTPSTAAPHRVTAGNGTALHTEHSPAWSPDGRTLAFLSDREEEHQLQLYVASDGPGTPRQLTHFAGYVADPKWSPDGKTIAVLNIAESRAAAGAVEAAERDSGEVAEHIAEARLVLVDVASGKARILSPADSYVYEYDWSPDGRQIAFIAAPGSGDNNWWIARLLAVDTVTGAVREIYRPAQQIAVPRWSPDGSQIAFIQGLMSDAGATGGDIWVVPAGGGGARDLTPGRGSTPAWLHWQASSGRILFTELVNGGTAVSELDPAGGKTTTLWSGDESIDTGTDGEELSLALAGDGSTCALVRSSFDWPPEVWLGPIGHWHSVTSANQAQRPLWGRAERIQWSSDGFQVQGWLMYPRNFDPHRRYPLIVAVHGGPAGQVTPGWARAGLGLGGPLAAEGYFIFMPNPRGSYGQGEAFTAANVRDFGHGDLRDILAGVDQVLKTAPIDERRIGLAGWSYGGYMTMWALTQTHRFQAAVAGAGIANWQSYYGENLIDRWMIPYFGASVYDDPGAYAQSSPMTYIRNVRTPTLILVGDSDKECPAPQSYEYWHALRSLGIETRLVVYADEGHHFRNPAHTQDLLARTIDWFNLHLR